MKRLEGRVAWVTGAGSGIGEAAAIALAGAGTEIILTGRREAPLAAVAGRVAAAGGRATVEAGDLTDPAVSAGIAERIGRRAKRLDILVNNAGINVTRRRWSELAAGDAEQVIDGNLSSALYCTLAALPLMRAQKEGLLIHVASMAGRVVSPLSGPSYTAAKHGVVAMSHSINMEECVNGIRSTVVCPGEVATPILDKRPIPVSAEERARMLQPADLGDLILYIATLPAHVCVNEVQVTPSWNRGYVAALARGAGA